MNGDNRTTNVQKLAEILGKNEGIPETRNYELETESKNKNTVDFVIRINAFQEDYHSSTNFVKDGIVIP
jgi:hypothetical protein